MPTFNFTSPDGQSYEIEGPEGATEAQAFQILKQQMLRPAYKDKSGKVISGLPGDRHDDMGEIPEDQRGFVDLKGNFLGREEAGKIAKSMGMDVPDVMHTSDLNAQTGLGTTDKAKMDSGRGKSWLGRHAESFGTGLKDIAVSAGQIGAHLAPSSSDDPFVDQEMLGRAQKEQAAKVDRQVAEREKAIQAERAARGETGTDWTRVAGNITGTLPLAALNPLAAGAASGALTPVTEGNFLAEKAKQVGLGAAAGKAGEVAGNMLGKVLEPTTDAAKKMLLDAGVTLTPGQMSGKIARATEEKAKSLPIAGDIVSAGEKRALDSYNVATVNKALEPLGISAQGAKNAREAIPFAQQKLSDAYNSLLPKLTFNANLKPPTGLSFSDELTRIETLSDKMPGGVGADLKQEIQNIIRDRLGKSGTMNGNEWKEAESELGKTVSGYLTSPLQRERAVGEKLQDVLGFFREGLERSNPGAKADLASINKGYAILSRIEDASNRSVTQEGAFTPAQLLQEVRTAAKKAGRRKEFAAGDSLLQNWGEAGQKIIGNKVPDSGTAGRWAITNTPALALGIAGSPLAAGHSELGMKILNRIATISPESRNALAQISRQTGQSSGAIGANALLGLTNGP